MHVGQPAASIPAAEKLENYHRLNQKKERRVIFQLTQRGFFSEINNLVLAILYCLENNIEFVLHSRGWAASVNLGWQDYFQPFCKETNNPFFNRESVFGVAPGRAARACDHIQRRWLPRYLNAQDIWPDMRSPEFLAREFNIPELGISGDLFHAAQVILQMIFRPRAEITRYLEEKNDLLRDLSPYVSVHIRRGDKVFGGGREAEKIEIDDYIDKIKSLKPESNQIFISTDDYSVVDEFMDKTPQEWKITTFCSQTSEGYVQREFNNSGKDQKYADILALLTDIRFLSRAEWFVGTYSSNVALFVALLLGRDRCCSLDIKEWHPF